MENRRRELNTGGKPPATKEFGIKVKIRDENLEQLLKLVRSGPTFDYSSFSSSSDDSSDEKNCSKQRISNALASFFTEPEPLKGNCDDEDEEEDQEISDQNLAESSAQVDNTGNEKERFLEVCVRHEDGKRSNAEALKLYIKGDRDRAIHEFKWAAKHCHNISAYYNLGVCFMEKQDIIKAICYYKVAAADDHAKASYNIACIIFNYRIKLETKYTEADGILFLKRAAELGLKQAQTEYGIILMEKKETVEVAEMAAEFLELAARQNVHLFHSDTYYSTSLLVL